MTVATKTRKGSWKVPSKKRREKKRPKLKESNPGKPRLSMRLIPRTRRTQKEVAVVIQKVAIKVETRALLFEI